MKKRSFVAVMGVLTMFAMAGCQSTEGSYKEAVTKVPEAVTPAGEADPTTPVQGEEEFPYEYTVSVEKETEEGKDGDVTYFISSICYDVFEGNYADNLNRFVMSLVEEFRETLPEAKENAKYDYEESKKNDYGMQLFPEAEELTVSCVWSKEQLVVLKAEYYSNSGGAHPNLCYRTYVVDMTDGNEETLETIISPYGITTEETVNYVKKKLLEEHGEILNSFGTESYLEDTVRFFTQNNQWYLNEKGLVLFANPYDIAAYAYGMIECEISYEELEQGLKK